MENITVNLITNKQNEIEKFLKSYFNNEQYTLEDKTFRFTCIFPSALKALDLIIVAAEAEDDYLIQVLVNLPEFDAIVNQKNLDAFIRYIYYRENKLGTDL